MQLADFFTDFDDALSGEANTDPLGLTVIWSTYGQKIFGNRINSISNDVRNFTLSLFHHYVVKQLVALPIAAPYVNAHEASHASDTFAFKNSCLIHMENLFAYAMVELSHGDNGKGAETAGVLGISNAAKRYAKEANDPLLTFGHAPAHQILRRQLLLGVSGRYKTPMIEMQFFDRTFRYQISRYSQEQWDKAEAFVKSVLHLAELATLLMAHFTALLAQKNKAPSIQLSQVDPALKCAYITAFRSSSAVGAYARTFWLETTGLSGGIAGAILRCLDRHAAADTTRLASRRAIEQARLLLEDEGADPHLLTPVEHIQAVEPFLADLDLLFNLALRKTHSKLADLSADWARYGRDVDRLPKLAADLQTDPSLLTPQNNTGKHRLQRLLKIADCTDLHSQLSHLRDYHASVMQARGQSPWLSLNVTGDITVNVRTSKPAPVDKRWPGSWVHGYYVPEFNHFATGLRGVRLEAA